MRCSNTTIRILGSLAFALTTGVAAYGQSRPSAILPTFACTVLLDDAAGQTGEPIRLSNLKRVPMRATLIGPPVDANPLRMAGPNASGRDQPEPTVDVVVRPTTDPLRPRVETRVVQSGSGFHLGEHSLHFTLEIPLAPEARRANIERYLQRTGQESTKAGRGEESKQLTANDILIATLESMYMENMAGDYEVTCAYSAQNAGRAKAEIQSAPPIKIHVFFESSFFDQPAFR